MKWRGKYSSRETVSWGVYDDDGRIVAYAVKRAAGKWKASIRDHNTAKAAAPPPHLTLDDDPTIFMPHLLMTLYGAQHGR
jgi:hypothetical protein